MLIKNKNKAKKHFNTSFIPSYFIKTKQNEDAQSAILLKKDIRIRHSFAFSIIVHTLKHKAMVDTNILLRS